MSTNKTYSLNSLATLVTPLRLVLGWQFFSAFLRRVVNDPEKLNQFSSAYMGHAFNHFLSHALFIKPMIEYFITHQQLLYIFLITFTIIEGLVGIALLLGLFTRLSAIGAALLSFGILLGAGWLGSTCVDEWQIGIAGIASGLVVFTLGAGYLSLDNIIFKSNSPSFIKYLTSNDINWNDSKIKLWSYILTIITMFIALYSYQEFHGGLYGKLFNLSKKPKIEILDTNLKTDGTLIMTLYRIDGPDTYGAFITKVELLDKNSNSLESFYPNKTNILENDIQNFYLNKVTLNDYSLIIPLGAKSKIRFIPNEKLNLQKGSYKVNLSDVSGLKWSKEIIFNE
ncbi:MAG: TQO small subunit DoxD [Stygiobacter sp.]